MQASTFSPSLLSASIIAVGVDEQSFCSQCGRDFECDGDLTPINAARSFRVADIHVSQSQEKNTKPPASVGVHVLQPLCRFSTLHTFQAFGNSEGHHATTACGGPLRSSDLNGQGWAPLQGGEGLNVV